MNTQDPTTTSPGAPDEAWRTAGRPPPEAEDEPRTVAYTGAIPRWIGGELAHYVVVSARDQIGERRIEVDHNPLVVGRSSKCNVVIADARVSSRHLQLRLDGDRLMVEDLNSSNGTFLDGNRISGAVVFPVNGTLQMGDQVLRHEYRSRSEVDREKNLASDLLKARSFIEALLPRPLLEGPERTSWQLIPSAMLGGDAFGHHALDADRMAIYLLDVCGHGTGAAMLSVSAMNTIRRQSLPRVDFGDPAQVVEGLNAIFQMDDHDSMYFSLWYGVYDRRQRSLTYCSAGHPPALLIGPGADRPRRLMTKGMAVGMMPFCRPQRGTTPVEKGDRLYLFSDGVFEVVTKAGREWTFEEFAVEAIAGRGPVEREAGRLYERVRDLSIKPELDDDFTLVVMDFLA